MKRRLVIGIMLILLLIGMLTLAFNDQLAKAHPEPQLLFETDKYTYISGENVSIKLTNVGNGTVPFSGWPPWTIYTYPAWEPVYPEVFAFLAWDLGPGESETWTWNQYDAHNERLVGPSFYIVHEYNHNYTVLFEIRPSLELEMVINNTEIIIGEPTNITFMLTNTGISDITLKFAVIGHKFEIFLYDSRGRCVTYWSAGCWFFQLYGEITLKPEEKYTETLQWNLYIYDPDIGFYPPPPGQYYLGGMLWTEPFLATPPLPIKLMDFVTGIVDINPDALNLKSVDEWIVCYIELPDGYEVADIDVSKTILEGIISIDPAAPAEIGDYDNDAIPDLMVKFSRGEVASWIYSELGIQYGNVTLTISGELYDGTPFEGTDAIKVLFPGDADDDGDVDFDDFTIFAGCYGMSVENPSCNPLADFDEDGHIKYDDFLILAGNYGKTAA